MDAPSSAQATQVGGEGRERLFDVAHSRRDNLLALVAEEPPTQSSAGGLTRRRVLHAAVGLFAKHGYEGCNMKMLAAAGRVKAPALYNYFASKQQILAESIEVALGSFFRAVLEPLATKPVEDWLESMVRRHATYKLRHLAMAQASDLLLEATRLTPHLAKRDLQMVTSVQGEYMRLVRDLARAMSAYELSEDDGTVAAFAIIAMCDRVSDWYKPAGSLTPEEIADHTWRLIRRMLGPV